MLIEKHRRITPPTPSFDPTILLHDGVVLK
jgi:hypothetical protein